GGCVGGEGLGGGGGEGTFFKDFGVGVGGGVLHRDEHALRSSNQVHGASHAFEHFARNGPIREHALFIHLQRPENGEVHVPAANHPEGIGGRKIASAGKLGDGFFARVDEVGINFGLKRIWADAEHPVL